ncbi:MAG: hypothetical protein M3535_06410, partial [Actinomycetota bacterium]|nr:hypothetical protein [Actinomycetota bacterium]
LDLVVDDGALAWLAERGYDPDYGARPLKRVIQREIGDRLAMALLEGAYVEGDTVTITVSDDELRLDRRSSPGAGTAAASAALAG